MSRAADVLILAAKNLNKFRFQTNIWSAMTMVRVKCSEHNFHIASFSAEQVVIKWRRRYYWSRVRRGKRSIICTRKIYLIYSFWKSVSWSFFQQRKRPGSNKLLPSTEAVWCHYNFFQKQKRFGVFWLFPATESVSWIMTSSNNERSRFKYQKRLVVVF